MVTDGGYFMAIPNLIKAYVHIVPNVLTFMHLISAFIALIFASQGMFEISLNYMVLALIFDAVDGKLARCLNASSKFGSELDALVDMVSFSVVPSYCVYKMFHTVLGSDGVVEYISVVMGLLVLIPGFTRSAWFKMNLNATDPKNWVGLPISPAGIFIVAFISFVIKNRASLSQVALLSLVTVVVLICAYLMLSKIEYRRFRISSSLGGCLAVFGLGLIFIGYLFSGNEIIFFGGGLSYLFIIHPFLFSLLEFFHSKR